MVIVNMHSMIIKSRKCGIFLLLFVTMVAACTRLEKSNMPGHQTKIIKESLGKSISLYENVVSDCTEEGIQEFIHLRDLKSRYLTSPPEYTKDDCVLKNLNGAGLNITLNDSAICKEINDRIVP